MTGMGGCGCPISCKAVRSSSPLHVLENNAPISASAADAMTLWMTSHKVCTGPLIWTGWDVGFALYGSDKKRCPPAQLQASSTNMKDASEWMWRTILDA
eukprot:1791998-Ditylum_brightwellii.AAC.1